MISSPRVPSRWNSQANGAAAGGRAMVLPMPRRGAQESEWQGATRSHLYELSKRLLDVSVSAIMLLLLMPLFALVAIMIKLQDRGPVLYVQKRTGRGGREFDFPKFRSMVQDADRLKQTLWEQNEQKDGVVFKIKADPRITTIGRYLRKYSIDELPQFFCVLKGDMSLVGPRPPLPSEVALYTPMQRRRLDVTPGLTCFWQIQGRADLDFTRQVALDLDYIAQRNLLLDLKILARTVPAVISARGSY